MYRWGEAAALQLGGGGMVQLGAWARMHACSHTHTRARCTHTCTHARSHTHMRTYTRTRTHTLTHAHTHIHTQTHAHTYTHTQHIYACVCTHKAHAHLQPCRLGSLPGSPPPLVEGHRPPCGLPVPAHFPGRGHARCGSECV